MQYMDILNILKRLRDDIKTWVTNNLYFLNTQIENKVNKDELLYAIEGLASEPYVDAKVASLVNSAPETLNTIDELAKALNDDENFAITVTNQIAEKVSIDEIPIIIDSALAQAKNSGEFNGYSPVREIDYWTDDDKAEIKSYVDDAILGGAW